jgi:hypothetical protein
MFDDRQDATHLLQSLERFMHFWCGDSKDWYGTADDKLAAVVLPDPLRDLYAFAGNWPGDNFFHSAFTYCDHLLAFELLTSYRGKLVFGYEPDGGPLFGTEPCGKDPGVWTSRDDAPWEFLCESLAQFIVTMCLRECAFGGRHKARSMDLLSFAKGAGLHVSPLWLNGPFVHGPINFYIVEAALLVMEPGGADQRGSTHSADFAQRFPDLFRKEETPRTVARDDAIRDPTVPLVVRQSIARLSMREHSEQAEYHAAKAAAYRRILENLQSDGH